MNLVDFLANLRRQNISLWSSEGRLKYEARAEPITPEMLDTLREHKAELLPMVLTEEEITAARWIEDWNKEADARNGVKR